MVILYLIALGLLLLSLPGFSATFVLGLVAAHRALRNEGEYAETLVLLAFHLWEPLLTFIYIVVIQFLLPNAWQRYHDLSASQHAFLWTIPMIIHITPVFGLRIHAWRYQAQIALMGGLG